MAKKRKKAAAPARRKPQRVAAAVRVTLTIEKDLLAAAEQYAAAHRTTVSEIVAEGLRKVVGSGRTAVLPPGDAAPPAAADTGAWAQLLAWMEEQQAALTEIRNTIGDVAASLPNDSGPPTRPSPGTRIPPP